MTACWGSFVVEELFFTQTFDKDQRIPSGLTHMVKVIAETVIGHTGRACSSTCWRNFTGRSPGVSRSTLTPNKSSSST